MGKGEGLCFDRGFLGDRAPPHLYFQVIGNPLKNGGPPIVVRNNFQEGFGHYTDQNTPFQR